MECKIGECAYYNSCGLPNFDIQVFTQGTLHEQSIKFRVKRMKLPFFYFPIHTPSNYKNETKNVI